MFPASTTMAGQTIAMPNVCLTPSPVGPIPIPYPSISMLQQATQVSTKVTFGNKPVVLLQSQTPSTTGDAAGSNGGVVSGVFMGPAAVKKASVKVEVEGKGAGYQTGMMGMNGSSPNVPSFAQSVPSQSQIMIGP